jgi:hypothetical protein
MNFFKNGDKRQVSRKVLFHELTAGLDTIRFFPDPENS